MKKSKKLSFKVLTKDLKLVNENNIKWMMDMSGLPKHLKKF
jgi:hypothetical protein